MLRSAVIRTSKRASAAARSSTRFRHPVQFSCRTVVTSNADNATASARGSDSSRRIRNGFNRLFPNLECCVDLRPRHARKVIEKFADRIPILETIEQIPHRNTRPDKDRLTAHDVGVTVHDRWHLSEDT